MRDASVMVITVKYLLVVSDPRIRQAEKTRHVPLIVGMLLVALLQTTVQTHCSNEPLLHIELAVACTIIDDLD